MKCVYAPGEHLRQELRKPVKIPEPMKIPVNGQDGLDPSPQPQELLNAAILASENAALTVEYARLAYENTLMRLDSQGMMPMPYTGQGVHAWMDSPWGMLQTDAHAPDVSFTNRASQSAPKIGRQKKGADVQQGISKIRTKKRGGDVERSVSNTSGTAKERTLSDESTAFGESSTDDDVEMAPPQLHTTVMLQNLPNNFTRNQLIQLMNNEGFEGRYNLVYIPIDFRSKVGLGYAFIDLGTNEDAEAFFQHLQGFDKWNTDSVKVCQATWSQFQGIDTHVERFRNSTVMHDSVPDEFKPALFKNGVSVSFPEPTKRIRAPRTWPRRKA